MIENAEQIFIKEYNDGNSFANIKKKYGWDYKTMNKWKEKNGLQDNYAGRFSQKYEIFDDHAEIWIKSFGGFVKAKIDIEDVEKCKNIGIWTLTKAGYVINCKTGIYLHRLVMDCPDGVEVDHIYHDLLDNRKSQLRYATSSQQKMNTKKRKDNRSGQRGVSWNSERSKWCVNLRNKTTRIYKRFDSYEEACDFAKQSIDYLHKNYQYKIEGDN